MGPMSFQNGIHAAEGILNEFGSTIMHPASVHDELVFVATRWQAEVFDPEAVAGIGQGRGAGVPVVERASDEHLLGLDVEQNKPDVLSGAMFS